MVTSQHPGWGGRFTVHLPTSYITLEITLENEAKIHENYTWCLSIRDPTPDLVGGFKPFEIEEMDHETPIFRGENSKNGLKPPASQPNQPTSPHQPPHSPWDPSSLHCYWCGPVVPGTFRERYRTHPGFQTGVSKNRENPQNGWWK